MKSPETKRRIAKVGRYHLYLFLLPACSVLFYGWLTAPSLNERADNPQRVAPLSRRGRILTRSGDPLAHTRDRRRVYPWREAAGSLVGYQLRGKNHTGLEASLQQKLSPPLPAATLSAALQQDRETREGTRDRLMGPDIQLTLEAKLQSKLYQAIQPVSGAVVVANSQGQILAAVSSPSFDPNQIAEKWQELRSDKRSPFIERVGGGLYPVKTLDNQELLSAENLEHRWLGEDPFPHYPGNSSALWIEERLLVTPLILLELELLQNSQDAPLLTLFPKPTEARVSKDGERELSPQLGDNTQVFPLRGPAFQESPPFLALIGRRQDGSLHFALVLEEVSPQAQKCQESILQVLEKWPLP